MFHEIANARQVELQAQSRIIANRMAWDEVSRIEKLERALRKASARLALPTSREAVTS